ncbi:MAG: MFS transporter [Pseudomonadota bacterium]
MRTTPSILLLAAGTFAVGTDAFIVSAFLPAMAHDLSVTLSTAGQSVTVFALAYALLAPPIAAVTATLLPPRRLLAIALALLAVANLGSALAPGFGLLLATRVLAAAAAGAYSPAAAAAAAALVPAAQRGRALAIVIGGLSVATAVGVPLGHLASQWMGWRAALAGVAGLCLLVAAGLALALPALARPAAVPLRARLQVLRLAAVHRILPLTVLGMAAAYAPYAFVVPLLESWSIAGGSVTAMLMAYGAGAVFGNVASGSATDRWGSAPGLLCAYAALAVVFGGLALLGTAPRFGSWWLVAALMFCWGTASWSQSPAQIHRLIAAAPRSGPVVVALNASAIYAGMAVGTGIGGVAMGWGPRAVPVAAALLALAALLYAWMSLASVRAHQ